MQPGNAQEQSVTQVAKEAATSKVISTTTTSVSGMSLTGHALTSATLTFEVWIKHNFISDTTAHFVDPA